MLIQYYTATSINGYIADESNSLKWLFQFGDIESMEESFQQFIDNIGTAVMGSSTYQWILDHEEMEAHPDRWPYDFPVWVFSHRKHPVIQGADIRFVKGDVNSVYREIQKESGKKNCWIIGGGDLAGQFYDAGLLNEIILSVAPVMLQSGAQLLPRSVIDPPLVLKRLKAHDKEFIELLYDVVYSKTSGKHDKS